MSATLRRLAFALAVAPIAASAVPRTYHFTLLDTPNHYVAANGAAINDRGVVVGGYLTHDKALAAAWSPSGVMHAGTAFGDVIDNAAYGLNNHGDVVGTGSLPGQFGQYHAFLRRAGVVTDLLPTDYESYASDIDDDGVVVGRVYHARGDAGEAFLWQGGDVVDLGTLGGDFSSAQAVSAAGVVGESSYNAAGNKHAFLWKDGVMTDLGGLGGLDSGAIDIDAAGTVVGYCWTSAAGRTLRHACKFQAGTVTDLGALDADGTESFAEAIGPDGTLVGRSTTGTGVDTRAILFADGIAIDLDALTLDLPADLVLVDASDANASGVIACTVQMPDRTTRACTLTPIGFAAGR